MKKMMVLISILVFASAAMVDGTAEGSERGAIGPLFLYPGDWISSFSTLYTLTDYDFLSIITVGSGMFEFTVRDCCAPGDTMINILYRYAPAPVGLVGYDYCTSPCDASVTTRVNEGIEYSVFIGLAMYIDCPAGLPAGYFFDIYFNAIVP